IRENSKREIVEADRRKTLPSQRHVDGVISRAKVLSVNQCNPHTQHAKLGFSARICKPFLRTERTFWISNLAGINEWAKPEGEQAVAVKVLVRFPTGQEEIFS